MVLCFTGTGNSRYVADRIANALSQSVLDMNLRIKNNDCSEITSEEPYIIVAPTFAYRMPLVLNDIIKKTALHGNCKMYFVLTCGDSMGDAGKYAKTLCDEKGMEYMGIIDIIMPENYIAMFNAPDRDKALKIIDDSEKRIDEAISIIASNDILSGKKAGIIEKFLTNSVNPIFYKLLVKDKKFKASDKCNSCGLCVKKCPLNNISLEMKDDAKKPVWHGNCTHCMACICYCPSECIEYGKKSVGQPRYKCPKL